MADFDLALAMAIAENSNSSQDDDFQLSSHAGQRFALNKLANTHNLKRRKRESKKTLSPKSKRILQAEKENYTGRINNGCRATIWDTESFNPAQTGRPLEALQLNFSRSKDGRNAMKRDSESLDHAHTGPRLQAMQLDVSGKVPSVNLNAAIGKCTVKINPSKMITRHKTSENPLIDRDQKHRTSISDASSKDSNEKHQVQRGPTMAGLSSSTVVPSLIVTSATLAPSRPSLHNQTDIDEADGILSSPRREVTTEALRSPKNQQECTLKPSAFIQDILLCRAACGDDSLIIHSDDDIMIGRAQLVEQLEETVSLAEENNLVIDQVIDKQPQQLEPGVNQAGKLCLNDCPSSANVNSGSQFSALLRLCINAASEEDEDKDADNDSLTAAPAEKCAPFEEEEAITSLMTQTKSRNAEAPSSMSQSQDTTEFVVPKNLFSKTPQKTRLEDKTRMNDAAEFSDLGDHLGADSGLINPTEDELEPNLECPVCGCCISGLSLEEREVHTNACLDDIDKRDGHNSAGLDKVDNDQAKSEGRNELGECVQEDCSFDVGPVLRWLETLNLSRYASIFTREEIDWDTLQCLSDEDLCNLGITALGPRRKILHSLQQMGIMEYTDQTKKQDAEMNQQVEADVPEKKLITDFFELPPGLQRKGAACRQLPASSSREKAGHHGSTTRRRVLTEIRGIPEWMCIPGTQCCVDAFQHLRADCSHWFLTHFHTDHYQGLTRAFRYGHVYCSQITAQLVNSRIGVPWERLKALPLNETVDIDGVKVTLLDANHCPGSVMILFEPQNGKAVLHTGDFRFCEEMARNAMLQACNIHTLILDTTYCNPQYDFPKQEVVIQFIIDAIQAEAFNPSTLFLIGTYTVGKERIFMEVAKALQKKVYVSATKLRLLQCMGFPDEDMGWLTTDDREANVHVVPLWSVASFKRMNYISRNNHPRYNSFVSFSPTGWSFGRGKKRTPGRRWQQGTIIRYEVPYSEHCSFKELRDFVRFVNPVNIVPSVHNDSAEAADAMVALLLNDEND